MRSFAMAAVALLVALTPCSAPAQSSAADSLAAPPAPVRAAPISGTYGHFSPGAAFATGVLCTGGPLVVASLARPSGSGAQGALLAAAGLGVLVGPAIGLSSGGRADLAERGLLVRMAGTGAVAIGVLGFANLVESEQADPRSTGFLTLGLLGAVAATGSAVIDLLSTPVVVESGPPRPHAELLVAPDRAGLAVRF